MMISKIFRIRVGQKNIKIKLKRRLTPIYILLTVSIRGFSVSEQIISFNK